ncbi:MAG: glycogen-binding domain-containing protein, partial [bacterium]|nr:glycogen-binding domain-containing protein [bacterium]
PGRYEYKFIVDGNWKEDPLNPNKKDDGYGGFNSVVEIKADVKFAGGPKVTKEEVIFEIEVDANSVLLAGSFNNWQGERMQKVGNKWVLKKKLPKGRHQYKFIIDGTWKEDPFNPNKTDDGYGGFNSVVEVK